MSEYLLSEPIDFIKHNEEVKRVWSAFESDVPYRAPITFSMNPRMIIQNPELNHWKYTWKDVFENPEACWTISLEFQNWVRHNVLEDAQKGLPIEWNGIHVGYQNCDEAMWFGCKIHYPENDMPFVRPMFQKNKYLLYETPPPKPFEGELIEKAQSMVSALDVKRAKEDFKGIPIGKTTCFGCNTDGPLTLACNLRGASEVMSDIIEDPKYFHDLMTYITDATINRIHAHHAKLNREIPFNNWGFADDSIELISDSMYREHVLPYHQKLMNAFSKGMNNYFHICGRVQHHLKTIYQHLNVRFFDLGFPTDMGQARRDTGLDAVLQGNIAPHLLKEGTPLDIALSVERLSQCGVMDGGRFILADGNNCAPCTPVANFTAMYSAGKRYAVYQ